MSVASDDVVLSSLRAATQARARGDKQAAKRLLESAKAANADKSPHSALFTQLARSVR